MTGRVAEAPWKKTPTKIATARGARLHVGDPDKWQVFLKKAEE